MLLAASQAVSKQLAKATVTVQHVHLYTVTVNHEE